MSFKFRFMRTYPDSRRGAARVALFGVVLAAIVAAAAWWVWAYRPTQVENGLKLELITRAKTSSIHIPLRWDSFRNWVPTSKPSRTTSGRYDVRVSGTFESRDEISMSTADLEKVFALHGVSGEPSNIWLPSDVGLVLCWDELSEAVTFKTGQEVNGIGTEGEMVTVVASWERPWPTTTELKELRRVQGPDERMWWAAPSFLEGDQDAETIGLGFAGILRQDGGYFAPRGTRHTGPDSVFEAWLNVGRDSSGSYYFWFSAE